MADPRTLDPLTQPLWGDHLIEASAGTGKTFTIAFLYVRLVLGHGQQDPRLATGLMSSEILVVTFTEAATKELRDRIRARLTQAAQYFAAEPATVTDDPGNGDLLFRLRASIAAEHWPGCRRKLALAAESMDEAAISTIHGWCNRMLNEHAFDSGSLFRQTLKTDELELLDEVVRDYWRTFFYPVEEDLMNEVLALWKQPRDLRQDLRNLLPLVEALPRGPADIQAMLREVRDRRQLRADELRALPWRRWQGEVTALLTDLNRARRLNGNTKNAMLRAWDSLLDWVDSDELLPAKLISTGFSNQTPEGLAEKVTGEGAVPHHDAFDAIADILAFSASMPSPRKALLGHATHWVAARVESEQQQRAEMGFNDLLTRLDRALRQPDQGARLAATIRRQFPAALIDEFQDTDPVQYRIFESVYRLGANSPETGLLLIGDPKQAIYAFRGADIFTYLRARDGVADRLYTLGTNFRSSAAMVAAVNQLFRRADEQLAAGAFLFRSGDSNRLPFHPVSARGREDRWEVDGETGPALSFWTQTDDKAVSAGDNKAIMAGACASEIVRLLNLARQERAGFRQDAGFQPLQPRDIAVLVNGITEATAVREALARRRIRSVYLSDRSSVLQSPVALDLLHWLRACAEPQQLSRLRAALGAPTLALPFERLDRLLSDEQALEREIAAFRDYQMLWQTQGVLPMIRRFLMDHRVPEKLLAGSEGERQLTDLLHIAELLQQDSQQLDGEHALIHHYTEMLGNADDEAEHLHIRLESDADLVKVVTIHKSKGLEYPLVFLPFATRFRETDRRASFVKTHDDQGELVVNLEPDDDTLAQADRERLGEDVRKLYVALTRARHASWVGVAEVRHWPASGIGYLMAGQGGADTLAVALDRLVDRHPAITVAPAPEPSEATYTPLVSAAPGHALEPVRPAREHWWIASYSAITYGARAGGAPAVAEDFPQASDAPDEDNLLDEAEPAAGLPAADRYQADHHGFPRGSGPGTFLHDLLEWCARQGFRETLDDPSALRDLLQRRCRLRNWASWAQPLEQWLLGLLATPLPLPGESGSRCALADLAGARPELEFWFESHDVDSRRLDALVMEHVLPGVRRPRADSATFNGMLKGFIDLVFEHQGRYYLLDYKSNALGNVDGDYTLDAMTDKILGQRYDLQYVIYLLALHRLLKARLPEYDYDRHMGGSVYLFLRGYQADTAGVFGDRPPRALIEALDTLFSQREQAA